MRSRSNSGWSDSVNSNSCKWMFLASANSPLKKSIRAAAGSWMPELLRCAPSPNHPIRLGLARLVFDHNGSASPAEQLYQRTAKCSLILYISFLRMIGSGAPGFPLGSGAFFGCAGTAMNPPRISITGRIWVFLSICPGTRHCICRFCILWRSVCHFGILRARIVGAYRRSCRDLRLTNFTKSLFYK